MTDRERAVLRALRSWPCATPAAACRLLNLRRPCAWCPVGPPREGEKCATVPRASRERVARVLRRLVRSGRVQAVALRRTSYRVV